MSQWSDDPLRDDEFPDEMDDDETGTVACASCGREIAEDAPQCPYCGEWGPQDGAATHRPVVRWLAWMLLAVLLGGTLIALLRGLGR